jgi:hypothetical protein
LAPTLIALLSGSSILVGRRLLHCVVALAGRRRLGPTLVTLLSGELCPAAASGSRTRHGRGGRWTDANGQVAGRPDDI